jgi:hypothetical protein
MNKLGIRSKKSLENVRIEIGLIIGLALARGKVDFTIIDGFRTQEDQMEKFKNGASQLDGINKISQHQKGLAFDFIPYPFNGNWNNLQPFKDVHKELSYCSKLLGYVPRKIISWDTGHFAIEEPRG